MQDKSSIIFTGDIGFDHYMDEKWKDPELLDDKVLEFLNSGEHLVINVEGPLYMPPVTDEVDAIAALKHGMDPEVTRFFNDIGADVWNICNNHIMDMGPEGMENTLKEAKRCEVKTLGAGMNIDEARRPVIFNEAGGIGMIGVGYQRACRKADENTPGCFSWSDMDAIKKSIEEIKKTCRWCIVIAHGGEEFTALPSPYTRDRYIEYLNLGADVVVSHHPHVPLNYELIGEKAIFYSLGNFIFDTDYQRSQYNTEKGIFVKLSFTENSFSFEPFGICIDRNTEHVVASKLPDIFENVTEKDYELLIPLALKMFIKNTKKQWKFLKPDKFANATEEDWYNNFYEPMRSGRVPGEVLDFQIVYPLSLKADEEKWKLSELSNVKNYILSQLNDDV